jgi:hypothetical protein
MGHVAMAQAPSIFLGDVEPTNIRAYIRRFHVTDGYNTLYSSIPRNIKYYICRCYVPRVFHRLIEEFTINSLVR